MSGTSPVARQRELGTRLRALRNDRGMTVEEVAAELLCSTTKISRLETAARRPSLRDVRDLCLLYGLDEQMSRELMSLARRLVNRAGGHSTRTSASTRSSGWNKKPQALPATRCTTCPACCRRKSMPSLLSKRLRRKWIRMSSSSELRPEFAVRKCWAKTVHFIAYYLMR